MEHTKRDIQTVETEPLATVRAEPLNALLALIKNAPDSGGGALILNAREAAEHVKNLRLEEARR